MNHFGAFILVTVTLWIDWQANLHNVQSQGWDRTATLVLLGVGYYLYKELGKKR